MQKSMNKDACTIWCCTAGVDLRMAQLVGFANGINIFIVIMFILMVLGYLNAFVEPLYVKKIMAWDVCHTTLISWVNLQDLKLKKKEKKLSECEPFYLQYL